MKKIYTITLGLMLGTGFLAQSQLGEIPNGGFENWSTNVLYDTPTDWESSNTVDYRGVSTIEKSTDAADGSYSAKLVTGNTPQDTLQAYVFHGTVGAQGPGGGIAYNSTFTDVAISYKADLQPDDTLFMLVIRFVSGSMTGMDFVPITVGQNTTWQRDTLSVTATIQDELFIGFVIGPVDGAGNGIPGSSALIDNVKMLNNGIATTDLPNFSFETWNSVSAESVDNWYTLNPMLAPMGMENAIKTIDAYEGNYAIEMTTLQPGGAGTDTIPSFVSMGVIDFNAQSSPFLPVSYGAAPATFSGAYKYSPVNGDEAAIMMQFYEAGVPVGSHQEILTAQTTYTTFTSNLTITGSPDSLMFVGYSGENPGSVLKLDALAFDGGNVSIGEIDKEKSEVYPNPASGNVTIDAGINYNYSILDITGKQLAYGLNKSGAINIDLTNFVEGAYFVKITQGDNVITKKLIVQ